MLPGKDGNKYIPYEKRSGNESIVYFTRGLSAFYCDFADVDIMES